MKRVLNPLGIAGASSTSLCGQAAFIPKSGAAFASTNTAEFIKELKRGDFTSQVGHFLPK